MKDKTKKWLAIAGLLAVCAVLVFGISRVLYHEPDTPPSYEEEKQEEPAPAENQTPKTGDTKDGMVYVEGFGWITDEGEGSGIYADDMYENGNKIGIMD